MTKQELKEAQEKQDKDILNQWNYGMTIQQIANEEGMSKRAVNRIIKNNQGK